MYNTFTTNCLYTLLAFFFYGNCKENINNHLLVYTTTYAMNFFPILIIHVLSNISCLMYTIFDWVSVSP